MAKDPNEMLQKLEDILRVLAAGDDYAKKDDVIRFFKELSRVVRSLEAILLADLKQRFADSEFTIRRVETRAKKIVEDAKNTRDHDINKARIGFEALVERISAEFTEATGRYVTSGDVMAMLEEKMEEHYEQCEMDGAKIVHELTELEGDARLPKSAVAGIEEMEADIKEVKERGKGVQMQPGGARGLEIFLEGVSKGFTPYLNLVAGAGISFALTRVGERVDLTIDASGSSGLGYLAATGTVDDSNTAFTFASEPTLVIINGASYRHGHGVTISGTSVTLDSPVGTGGDIYGLG